MTKHRIKVYDYHDAWHGSSPTHYDKDDPPEVREMEVDAYCAGGREGVRAYFIYENSFCVAHGDDGHWWLVGGMSPKWIDECIQAMMELSDER